MGSEPLAVLRARTSAGELWDDPTESLLLLLLEDLDIEEPFVIVERLDAGAGDHYMQVLYEEPDRYRMEFREGTSADHFHVAEIPLERAHEILAAYACELPRWREAADWRPLSEEPGHLSAVEGDAVEQPCSLYISSVVGGEARDDVLQAIRRLAVLVRQADAASTEQLGEGEAAVDLVFHVPGSLSRPDYEGLRTGRWFKADRVLVVQVAVPEALSTDPAAVDAFVGDALRSAVSLARGVLTRRKLHFSLDRAASHAERATGLLSKSP